MTGFDQLMMARAIKLAKKAIRTVSPNPAVGCVICQADNIVGEGWHERAGLAHAEVNALKQAGELAKGATVYVSLEPCSHTGRTAPCANALIDAGIKRVVYAMQDPNPQVSGQGLAKLQEAGIQVDGPVMEKEALQLNKGFVKRHQTGLPWVTVKLAMSADGRTAMASGESQWITGAPAREDVQQLRAESCAIITGINTVLQDDARLTVRLNREGETTRQPLRVVLDSQAKLSEQSALLNESGDILQLVADGVQSSLKAAQLEQLQMANDGGFNLQEVLVELANRQCNRVLVEAGSQLAGSFISAGLADELVVYMAPTLLGSNAKPLLDLPMDTMAEQKRLTVEDIRSVGEDIRITYTPQ